MNVYSRTCHPTHWHVDLLYTVPLHTLTFCEEHLTPDLIESQIKGSFWLRFAEESWPQHFNYSVSVSTQAHRHFINSIMDAMTEFIWAWVMEVKEENEQRRREKHLKGRKWDKKMKGKELVFSHKTILERWQPIRFLCAPPHTASDALSCLFNLSSPTFCLCLLSNVVPFLTSPFSQPLLFPPITLTTERTTPRRAIFISLHLRPPKIRNSPLIWNKWPSSGKPKPSDSAAWFIKGAWSRKLVQP